MNTLGIYIATLFGLVGIGILVLIALVGFSWWLLVAAAVAVLAAVCVASVSTEGKPS